MNGQFYPGVMLGRTSWLVNEGTGIAIEGGRIQPLSLCALVG